MRGVILCGGTGSRLDPLTRVTNKHLLPVYNKPMIYYPIDTMIRSGITDILLVCGGNSAGDFLTTLGNGKHLGVDRLHYTYQSEARGIADALGLARDFADNEPIVVMLGDNVLQDDVAMWVREFEKNPQGAMVFTSKVKHPEHYGVPIYENNRVVRIEEKPKHSTSNEAVIGLYMYDSQVWDYIDALEPSTRGELEITDVNNFYCEKGQLRCEQLEGFWLDCGESFEAYMDAALKVRLMEALQK